MVQNKDLKRLVRSRMRRTGESYTAARAQLQKKQSSAKPSRPPEPDYAALAGQSDAVIKQRTGRTWKEWAETLDSRGAHTLPHREIARMVSNDYGVAAWWTQTVAVGYERIKGIRERGQRRDGSYEASKSRTFAVPVEKLFAAWQTPGTRRRWLEIDGVKVRSATASKAMRLGWPDGTIVVVLFSSKGKGKSAVAVQHTKLPSQDARDRAKREWGERFDTLGKALKV
jgi:hypothetical protein